MVQSILESVGVDELRAQRDDMAHAMVRVEAAMAAPDAGRRDAWVAAVLRTLVILQVELEEHVEWTEDAEAGFFGQVIDHAPHLVPAVKKLTAEHVDMAAGIARCKVLVTSSGDDVTEARDETLRLLGLFSRHRNRGANLAYDAFNIDLSTGD